MKQDNVVLEKSYRFALRTINLILETKAANSMLNDCEELIKILATILKTLKKT